MEANLKRQIRQPWGPVPAGCFLGLPQGKRVSPIGLTPPTVVSEWGVACEAAFWMAGGWRGLGLVGLLGLLLRRRGSGLRSGEVRGRNQPNCMNEKAMQTFTIAPPHNNARQFPTKPFLNSQLSNKARMGGVTRQGKPSSPTAGVSGAGP